MAPPLPVVLIIEDEPHMRRFLRASLRANGYQVVEAATAREGLAQAAGRNPEVILLDLGLPDGDGHDVARQLRRSTRVPIIVLSARGQERDKVAALDLGADDYLTKPFQVAELLARCRALVRRANGAASSVLLFGSLKLDLAHKEASQADVPLDLTRREWSILECLVLNAGRVVSKEKLMSAVASWNEEITPNAVEVYVSRLRAKLGEAVVIRVIRGLGYRLDEARA